MAHAMELPRLLEALSTFEKRGMTFYRRFAARFHAIPEASRLWTEMSNAEAGHFAVLTLAQDLVQMGHHPGEPLQEITLASLHEMEERLAALETQGEAPDLTLAQAVHLALAWEEDELPRVLALLPALPPQARGRILSGVFAEASLHYDCLKTLAELAGAASFEERIHLLRRRVTEADASLS